MDDTLKWYFGLMILLFVGSGVTVGINRYIQLIETKQAMEHGYIQQVDPQTFKTIWVKAEGDENE